MEELSFDIGGILTEEEATKLFEEQSSETEEPEKLEETQETEEIENDPTEEQEEIAPEKVGEEEETEEEKAIQTDGGGSSPNVYSSIANALKKDGIFPDFEDKELDDVKTAEDFAELFEKAITARLDDRQKRIDEALRNGVEPDTVSKYEKTIQYLDSINEEALSEEGEQGEDLRKQIIYNDLIQRGYTHEKALKEVEKSFKSGSDVDDAKDALEALKKFYKNSYEDIQKEAKKKSDEDKEFQKKQSEDFRKLVLEDDVMLGGKKLDKKTCQRIYDSVTKAVHKIDGTDKYLTEVQKFQREHPLEFLKQLGMWFVLTDGGKNTEGFTKEAVRAEKNKAIKELANKINSTSLNSDGSLRYVSGASESTDPLLSDDWKVGW